MIGKLCTEKHKNIEDKFENHQKIRWTAEMYADILGEVYVA